MDIQTLITNEDLARYDELLNAASASFIFQTRPYLSTLKRLGYDYEIIGIFENGNLEYALPVQKKKFPIIKRYFYAIPYGIVSRNKDIPSVVIDKFLSYLKQKAYVIKLSLSEELADTTFKNVGMQTTLMIDLINPFETLFEAFSKTHRNCSRKAEKEGVVVTFETSSEIIETFILLYSELMKQKAIDSIDIDFLRECLASLINNNLGFFAVARFNGVIHNIAFITTIGKQARYLYGASLRCEEKVPPIGQYLHYEIIKELQRRGFSNYDLGGIPNLPVEESNPAYSVYKFKKGFGGNPAILCYDYVYTKYRIFKYLIR